MNSEQRIDVGPPCGGRTGTEQERVANEKALDKIARTLRWQSERKLRAAVDSATGEVRRILLRAREALVLRGSGREVLALNRIILAAAERVPDGSDVLIHRRDDVQLVLDALMTDDVARVLAALDSAREPSAPTGGAS